MQDKALANVKIYDNPCPYCMETTTDKIMDCGHLVCQECIDTHFNLGIQGKVSWDRQCPLCRTKIINLWTKGQ